MKNLTFVFCLLLLSSCKTPDKEFADHEVERESKYEPDIVDDFKNVDYQISQQWEQLYETVMAGYGYLKMECEDELKRAVQWVEDYYENVTSQYEQSLYDFEQVYISLSDDPDYQFLYDIEQIVYDGLDELEEEVLDAEQDLEKDYWVVIGALDKAQDDVENILEISQSRVDDIMDETESELEGYTNALNQEKWDVQEVEQDTANDIDDDIIDYYEEDEEDFNNAELAAINELQNDLTDVNDFDTAPTYKDEYEQIHDKIYENDYDINSTDLEENDESGESDESDESDTEEDDDNQSLIQIKSSSNNQVLTQKRQLSYLKGSNSQSKQVLIQTKSENSKTGYIAFLIILGIAVHGVAVWIVFKLSEKDDYKIEIKLENESQLQDDQYLKPQIQSQQQSEAKYQAIEKSKETGDNFQVSASEQREQQSEFQAQSEFQTY